MKSIFALTIVLAGLVSAYGQDIKIDDQTRCDLAFRAYDNQDKATVAAARYVVGVLGKIDRAYTAKGEAGILAAMSLDGLMSTSVLPIELCRKKPSATLFSQVVDAYDGIRAIEREMGTIK